MKKLMKILFISALMIFVLSPMLLLFKGDDNGKAFVDKLPKPRIVIISMQDVNLFMVRCGKNDSTVEFPESISKPFTENYKVGDTLK